MSPTQWALLIVGAVAVIAIYWFSRRERPEARRRRSEAPVKTVKLPGAAPGAGNDQMDMFSRFGEFDEFGVGKTRKRVSPDLGGGLVSCLVIPPSGKCRNSSCARVVVKRK